MIPGGESTTLWKFFEAAPWEEAIARFAESGRPMLGTCAGAIVLAREVTNPAGRGLHLIDISVERNAYGRQVDSFVGTVEAPALGGELPAVFIRAPKIRRVGGSVEILAARGGEAVLVRQGNVVAATREPVLLVAGTALTPASNFSWNYERAFTRLGLPYCAVMLPDREMADVARIFGTPAAVVPRTLADFRDYFREQIEYLIEIVTQSGHLNVRGRRSHA